VFPTVSLRHEHAGRLHTSRWTVPALVRDVERFAHLCDA
jgi:hypothetical protein